MSVDYDVAVVGAGVLGLAHAYALAKRGLRVAVCERHAWAQGASIRNFGMVWPVGQPTGPAYDLARRSAEIWRDVLQQAGLWFNPCGSLHLAYHDDEAAVLDEFAKSAHADGRPCETISAAQVLARAPAVNPDGLRCGLWSPTEINVDPRITMRELPGWLSQRYDVEFFFDTPVLGLSGDGLRTVAGELRAPLVVICTGVDFRDLAPTEFAESGLFACKLQMMRSQAYGQEFRLGAMLAGGLTLRHYKAFADCPSLPELVARFDHELPEYRRYGIHVMASQNHQGELILGDTHEYGDDVEPFDKPALDELVLHYLRRFLIAPDLRISARWNGTYVKHPTESYVARRIGPHRFAVTGVGGAGMTLSFGLAEKLVAEWLEE